MRRLGILVCMVIPLATSLAAAPHAAAAPLLVVVESAERGGPDAEAIRRSIGAELGTPVLAPADGDATVASDLLVVTVDKSRIRMSLRTNTTAVVTRTIDASQDRATRAREIAWLAGNLARDQVSALVTTAMPAERPVERDAQETAPPEPSPPPTVIPPSAPSTGPRPVPASVPAPSSQPVTVAAVAEQRRPSPAYPSWSVTAAEGPTVDLHRNGADQDQVTYQLEFARQASPQGLILGAAFDMSSAWERPSAHLLGLAAFAGTTTRYGRWLFEATAGVGLGVELASTTKSLEFSNGQSQVVTTYRKATNPGLYLRAAGGIGFALSSKLDLLVRLTVHLASAGLSTDFAGGTIGLRYRLP